MKKIKLSQIFYYALGSFCIAFALHAFHSPNNIVTGGVSGLGIILKSLSETYTNFSIPLWVTNTVVNAPLLLISYRIRGKDILIRSAIVVGFLSIFLWVLEFFYFEPMDLLISAIGGAVIMGAGLGLIFKNNATSGGTDLLSAVITKIFPQFTISKVLFFIDASIVVLGFLVFGVEKGLYGICAIFVCTKTIDYVLVGGDIAKSAIIITEKPDEVSKHILEKLDRGVTALYGKGMYTQKDRLILYCVVKKKQIIALKQAIREIDKNAFISIGEVHEVEGEGFAQYDENTL
ncbi:MAG: YitT family protein [Lachnospirales bacterium]